MKTKIRKKVKLDLLVQQHSGFLKANLDLIRLVLLMVFIVVIIMSGYIYIQLAFRTTPPDYVFNGVDIERTAVLDKPDIGNEALMRWTSRAISDIYTFNFLNLNEHFTDIKEYFTADGYDNFNSVIAEQGLASDAMNKRLIYEANSCDVVSITATSNKQSGTYVSTYWLIDIPLLIKITSASETRLRRFVISVVVEGGANISPDKSIGISAIKMNYGSGDFCKLKA